MARASTQTLIPLDRVAAHLQIDPWHFNGITSEFRLSNYACEDFWYQYGYQSSGKLSLEDLAFSLHEAEDKTSTLLGYTPLPRWFEEEVKITPHHRVEVVSFVNSKLQPKSVRANWGYIQEVGAKASVLVDTPATVFSDVNGDGLDETVTITFATTVTEEKELRVFYPNKNGREEWEIRPLNSVSIAGGIATITFYKYLIPLETLVEAMPSEGEPKIPIDGDDNANFLTEVDVYRIYSDPSQQVTFYYAPDINCSTTPCAESTNTGCLLIKDRVLGSLTYQRGDWDADTETYIKKYFYYEPIKAKIYYKAGWQDDRLEYPTRQMDQTLERLISFYALSMLDLELCGCDNTRRIWKYKTKDVSMVTGEKSFTRAWNDLSGVLGTSQAALDLFKYIYYIKRSGVMT